MNARLLLLLPALLVLLAADAPKKDAAKDKAATDAKQKAIDQDNKALHGVWKVVAQERRGWSVPKKALIPDLFEFADGNRFRMYLPKEKPGAFTAYRIDPTKTPKELDLKETEGWDRAIYKFDGDFLIIIWGALRDKERPKEFNTTENNYLHLFKLQRVKQ